MSKGVVIETEECIGCQSCVELCPDVFGFDEENEKATVLVEKGDDEACIQEAIDTCPVTCIHWKE